MIRGVGSDNEASIVRGRTRARRRIACRDGRSPVAAPLCRRPHPGEAGCRGMSRSATLLAAKLLPRATGPLHLRRPRLMDRLRAGLDRRATVVLAGPGYGKTALLSHFLQESG